MLQKEFQTWNWNHLDGSHLILVFQASFFLKLYHLFLWCHFLDFGYANFISGVQHPYVYGVLVFEAMATYVGQVSVLSLIALFGAATTAMVIHIYPLMLYNINPLKNKALKGAGFWECPLLQPNKFC